MADFKNAYAITAGLEGGYADHSLDRGGETWKGIARAKNPNWSGWAIVDKLKKFAAFPANLSTNTVLQAHVESFYKKQFWDALRLDDVTDAKIAKKLFDIAVNCGVRAAGKFLQTALNALNDRGRYYADLTVDGFVGSATVKALNSHPRPENIFKALNVLQGSHYLQIGINDESQEAFMNGWFANRIAGMFDLNKHQDMA